MSVSRSLRFQIFRRDGHTCRYCGATAPNVKLNVDHVVPETLGGSDDPSNLVTACADCNGGKSATPPDAAHVAQVADDAVRWSAAIRSAADGLLEDFVARDAARQAFDEKWTWWRRGDTGDDVPRPENWAQSVDQFIAAGLPLSALLDCVDTAMRVEKVKIENVFRYTCGIAWKQVNRLHAAAQQELAGRPAVAPLAPSVSYEEAGGELLLSLVVSLHTRGLRKPLMLIRRDLERMAASDPQTPLEDAVKRLAVGALAECASVINDSWDTHPLSPGFLFKDDPDHDPHDQTPPGWKQ